MKKEGKTTKTVTIARLLSASREDVFEAWTNADNIAEWLCPGSVTTTVVAFDLRVGGRFLILMRDGEGEHEHTGEYQRIERPRRLVFTWRSSLTRDKPTLVTVELAGKGKQTELKLTHEALPDEEAARKHTKGWQSIMDKLSSHLGRRGTP